MRQWDRETRRRGDKETGKLSPGAKKRVVIADHISYSIFDIPYGMATRRAVPAMTYGISNIEYGIWNVKMPHKFPPDRLCHTGALSPPLPVPLSPCLYFFPPAIWESIEALPPP
jgi:hypothetical protein